MAKPAPTRTSAKAPVSLSPVKALSTAGAPAQPQAAAADKSAPVLETSGMPKPVEARSGESKTVETAKPSGGAKPTEAAKPVEAAKPAEAAKLSETKPAEAKPFGTVTPVAPKAAPAEAVAATVAPKAATKPAATKPLASKPVAAKPLASAPVAAPSGKPVAAKAAAAPATSPIAPTAVSAPAAAIAVAASLGSAKPAAPVTLAALAGSLPRPPAFAGIATNALLMQTLTFARTFGALQTKMLEHACEELKATLSDVEDLARSGSAADAVALQAKAVRRGYDSHAAYLKDIASIAAGPFRQG